MRGCRCMWTTSFWGPMHNIPFARDISHTNTSSWHQRVTLQTMTYVVNMVGTSVDFDMVTGRASDTDCQKNKFVHNFGWQKHHLTILYHLIALAFLLFIFTYMDQLEYILFWKRGAYKLIECALLLKFIVFQFTCCRPHLNSTWNTFR